jgi:predicted RNase H-like nuclease (RuvC/YqgF family)
MLLNRVQRHQQEILLLEQEVDRQERENESLQERLVKIEAALGSLSSTKTSGAKKSSGQ